MSHAIVNYREVDPVADAMHFLRDPLGCDELGLTVVDCPPTWTGKAHDHADRGHEEIYLLIEGEATLEVDGDELSLTAGDAVRVAPDARRQVRNGATESTLVIAGAP